MNQDQETKSMKIALLLAVWGVFFTGVSIFSMKSGLSEPAGIKELNLGN